MSRRKVKFIRNKPPVEKKAGRYLPYVALVIFFGVLVFVIFFSDLLAVQEIQVNGLAEEKKEIFVREIESRLEGKYLDTINRNNILFVPGKRITNDFYEKYKWLEMVSIKKIFPDKLEISLQERDDKIVLCNDSGCYVIDENGMAFDVYNPEDINQKSKQYLFLKDLANKPVNLNETIFDRETEKFILEISPKLKDRLEVETADHWEVPNRVAPDIRVETQEGWRIFFNREIKLDKEIEMLEVLLRNKIEPSRRKDLEYIDLRSSNRIFYKFKEGSQEETESEVKGAETQKEEPKKESKKKKKK